MDSLFRGELVTKSEFINRLDEYKEIIQDDLIKEPINQEIVIEALHKLATEINKDQIIEKLLKMEMPEWAISIYIDQAIKSIEREEINKKLLRELGEKPFEWKKVTDQIEERKYPLGVIMHIGAGNALGLSALSVMEGLLTGNINILKLPEHEGGISLDILIKLVEIEPRLKPYIYVINVSSKNEEVISKLIELVDAVLVWGGDEAINALRHLTPPTIKLIEWGHRLSFAYFTKQESYELDLEALANDIVQTDQLYCSSPQCIFLETESKRELDEFAYQLFEKIKNVSSKYPSSKRSLDVQSQITWTRELVKTEEVLGEKKLYVDETKEYSVLVDYIPRLTPSPLFRNIWVMPIKRNEILNLLRKEKGHLQTVGLSCMKEDLDEMSNIFYSAGVNRVMQCGEMSSNYSGEPHDGEFALLKYVRVVNRKIAK
ncbi:acyl-CoA reductase [Mycoplasmatota bacterium]|nr:acyl-CoA reductase [Mycoplasmatota bacterium]